jgi:hypothetical protein
MNRKRIIIYLAIIFALFIVIACISVVGIINVGPGIPNKKDVWKIENRTKLFEWYSPDSAFKIGSYNYDAGAMGYTATNISISEKKGIYPIEGNILITDNRFTVNWTNNCNVEIIVYAQSINNAIKPKTIKYKNIIIQLKIG